MPKEYLSFQKAINTVPLMRYFNSSKYNRKKNYNSAKSLKRWIL